MSHPASPLFAMFTAQATGLRTEVAEMFELRLELVRAEAQASIQQIKRLAAVLAACGVLVLSGFVLLLLLASQLGALWLGVSEQTMLAWSGTGLAIVGCLAAWLAYRRFQRQFTGLEESLAELREDLAWLREWTGESRP